MSLYEVFATRWDDPHVVEQIPAKGLQFTLPLSDHGEASFSATVEPGRSFWRPALSAATSGILIARDGVPVWAGRVWSESQSGPRTFDFTCAEWGSFFERVPVVAPVAYLGMNDHDIFRALISQAQTVSGQNIGIQLGTTRGASFSQLFVNPWDDTTVEAQFRQLGDSAGGPEWYFAATGTLDNPSRTLVLGDQLGSTDPVVTLEYVEDSEQWQGYSAPPPSGVLGNAFPGPQPYARIGLRGGNVFSHPARTQDATVSATVALAIGAGDQMKQLRRTSTATDLLSAGYPRQTISTQYSDVSDGVTLQSHSDADLAAARGMVTTYTFSAYETDPDWTDVQRGDMVQVVLDTDVYAGERPLTFNSRLLKLAVAVPDEGPAHVNWSVANTRSFN
jgi:hypothetical protein